MKKVNKPWGYELIFAYTDRYVGKLLKINEGELLSRQYHNVKDETILVLEGEMYLELGMGENIERKLMKKHDFFRVKPKTVHRFIAKTDCLLVEVSTPELDDVVRLEDRYGREGTNAP